MIEFFILYMCIYLKCKAAINQEILHDDLNLWTTWPCPDHEFHDIPARFSLKIFLPNKQLSACRCIDASYMHNIRAILYMGI